MASWRKKRIYRPKVPPPGLKAQDVCKAAKITISQLYRWIRAGYLPPPEGKARHTRYTQEHIDKAIILARATYRPAILASALLVHQAQHPTPTPADPPEAKTPEPPQPTPAPAAAPPAAPQTQPGARSWQRWVLAPGVELSLAQDANPVSQTLAQTILKMALELTQPPAE